MNFASLTSGSCGNCYFFRTEQVSFLIDAGIGSRMIGIRLRHLGVLPETLSALFLTHDHADHSRGASSVVKRFHLPLIATEEVFDSLSEILPERRAIPRASFRALPKGGTIQLGDCVIRSFQVPHDCHTCVGYVIEAEGEKVVLATDVGQPTDEMRRAMKGATRLIIETDFDEQMLREGPYPEVLKHRITSGYGHLSNARTAELLTQVYFPTGKDTPTSLRNVYLCHLSGQNNLPSIAVNAIKEVLPETVPVRALPRGMSTELMEWR